MTDQMCQVSRKPLEKKIVLLRLFGKIFSGWDMKEKFVGIFKIYHDFRHFYWNK